jgi:Tfp pilus assembly protein PilX
MKEMTRSSERGIALVFTLFLMASLSALAVSLMFLSQTETSSTRNYRTMSQARYAGEAGVHKAINYLVNSYPVPTNMTGYDPTVSPVTAGGNAVVLSATAGISSNYPDSAVVSAFNAAAQGSLDLPTGTITGTVNYNASATLVSMRQITVYGGASYVIQTWQITAVGTVPGAMPATVEVTAMLERNYVSSDTYAIFATGAGCGAIDLRGTMHTDSYDSTPPMAMSGGSPVTQNQSGAVGTNGNLAISGNVGVNGNLDTPRTGVGDCHSGAPTALSESGSASVNGSVVQLPQAKVYPTPQLPSPLPPTTSLSIAASSCLTIMASISPAICTGSGNALTITTSGSIPLSLGNVSIGSNVQLTIQYGAAGVPSTGTAIVNLNSINLGAQSGIQLGANTSVTMNVVGTGQSTPIDFSGGSFSNTSFDPSKFQILYAGTGNIEATGGSGAAVTIYAPNAAITMHGSADIYGSILSRTYLDTGGATVHYDRSLSSKFFTLSNYVMTSFSWKKY